MVSRCYRAKTTAIWRHRSYYTPPVLVQALTEDFNNKVLRRHRAGTGRRHRGHDSNLPEGLRQACQFTAIEACPVAGTIARHALADVNVIVKRV